jgi:hypothetical protein
LFLGRRQIFLDDNRARPIAGAALPGLIFASGGGRFAYAQKVPEVVELVRELHGQRQSLRQISKTLAARGHLTGGGRPYTATAVQKMLRAG